MPTMDLEALILSMKDNPSVGLDPDEQKLVAEWRKLDDYWQQKVVELVIKAQEELNKLG